MIELGTISIGHGVGGDGGDRVDDTRAHDHRDGRGRERGGHRVPQDAVDGLLTARSNLRELALGLGANPVAATGLAIALSEIGRRFLAKCRRVEITVALDSQPHEVRLHLGFEGQGSIPAIPKLGGLFATVRTEVPQEGRAALRCVTSPMRVSEPLDSERIAVLRRQVATRSRAALMHELEQKNHELARREVQLANRVQQLETVAYVTTHDLRGGIDQALYDVDELTELIDELVDARPDGDDDALIDLPTIREILDNLRAATAQQVALLDGIDTVVALWQPGELKRQRFNATELVRSRVAEVDAFAEQSIDIGDLGTIDSDPDLIWTVLHHLIENALVHNDAPDKRVWVERSGIEVRVRDNGVGIPEYKQKQITQLFQRLDSSHVGLGLGLTICEALLERHGWTLSIESQPGQGSVFVITMTDAAS